MISPLSSSVPTPSSAVRLDDSGMRLRTRRWCARSRERPTTPPKKRRSGEVTSALLLFAPPAVAETLEEPPRRRVCCEEAEKAAAGGEAAAAAAGGGGGKEEEEEEDKGCCVCCSASLSVPPLPPALLSVGDCIGDAVVERRRCSPAAGGAGQGVGFPLRSPLMAGSEESEV